jgi:hypothetical protein
MHLRGTCRAARVRAASTPRWGTPRRREGRGPPSNPRPDDATPARAAKEDAGQASEPTRGWRRPERSLNRGAHTPRRSMVRVIIIARRRGEHATRLCDDIPPRGQWRSFRHRCLPVQVRVQICRVQPGHVVERHHGRGNLQWADNGRRRRGVGSAVSEMQVTPLRLRTRRGVHARYARHTCTTALRSGSDARSAAMRHDLARSGRKNSRPPATPLRQWVLEHRTLAGLGICASRREGWRYPPSPGAHRPPRVVGAKQPGTGSAAPLRSRPPNARARSDACCTGLLWAQFSSDRRGAAAAG